MTQPDNFNIDDFLSSQHQPNTDHDFDPGNRLEASGFNADDASAINVSWKRNKMIFKLVWKQTYNNASVIHPKIFTKWYSETMILKLAYAA